jgi:hypothetical protein
MNLTVEHGIRVTFSNRVLFCSASACFISNLALLLGKGSVLHFALQRRAREAQAKIDRDNGTTFRIGAD